MALTRRVVRTPGWKPGADRSQYIVVDTPESVEWLARMLADQRGPDRVVCTDTENRNWNPGDSPVGYARATCVTLSTVDYPNVYLDNYGAAEGNLHALRPWLESEDHPKVGHRLLPHDAHVFANHGITLRGVYADTLVMDFMLDTYAIGQHGLEKCLRRWFGEDHADYKETFSYHPLKKDGQPSKSWALKPHTQWWDEGHHAKVIAYACKDTREGRRLFLHHRDKLRAIPWARGRSYWDYYREVELPLSWELFHMERRGVRIDQDYLVELREYLEEVRDHHAREFYRQLEAKGLGTAFLEKFNEASTKQLAALLYDTLGYAIPKWTGRRPGEGSPSTDAEALETLRALGADVVVPLLEKRAADKLLSTYVLPIQRWAPMYGGRVHTSINQIGAQTGRVSAVGPNLLNIPVRTPLGALVRNLFVPDPGCVFVDADESQIEMRVAAHRSQDPVMMFFTRNNYNLHAMSLYLVSDDVRAAAEERFGLPPFIEEIGQEVPTHECLEWVKANHKEDYGHAKNFNFSIQYGATAHRAAKTFFGVVTPETLEKGEQAIHRYMSGYKGMAAYIQKQHAKARTFGYVRTMFGRYVHLPHAQSSVFRVQKSAERQSVNYDVQGSARDVIAAAMLTIARNKRLAELGYRMQLQVYDEILGQVPIGHAAEAKELVVQCMSDPYTPLGFKPMTVPTVADAQVGYSWGEVH